MHLPCKVSQMLCSHTCVGIDTEFPHIKNQFIDLGTLRSVTLTLLHFQATYPRPKVKSAWQPL